MTGVVKCVLLAVATAFAQEEACDAGSCEDSALLQMQPAQRVQLEAGADLAAHATEADVWLTTVDSDALPTMLLKRQSPVSFRSAQPTALLRKQSPVSLQSASGGRHGREEFPPVAPDPGEPQESLRCKIVDGIATKDCEVLPLIGLSANLSLLQSSSAGTGCCSWAGNPCDYHDAWCDGSSSNCAACSGQWLAACCSWDGATCDHHDWWCDQRAWQCGACSGQWITPGLTATQAPTTPPPSGPTFQPVDGAVNRACRGANSSDNEDRYYTVRSEPTLDACKSACLAASCCAAIEYNPGSGRCEIWAKQVEATVGVGGYECYRVQPTPECPLWDGVTRLTVDTAEVMQTMVGFGAAVTQASAVTLQDLKSRSRTLYDEVMQRLFGVGEDAAGISLVRFPIGSCDFSRTWSTYDDTWDDWGLDHFKLDADSELIAATLQDAKAINDDLILMGSPWTPPAWMKEQGTLAGSSNQNTLKSGAYDAYADYLLKVKEAFARRGIPLQYLTLQNEPLFGTSAYPGMYLSASNSARLAQLVKARIGDSPKLLAYDHNWNSYDYPEQAIAEAHGAFHGTAFHCYGGSMETAHKALHDRHPEMPIMMTECTGSYPDNQCDIDKGLTSFGWNHEWDMSNLFLNNALNWGAGGTKWNIALDERCGPVLPSVDYRWGRPLVSVPSWASSPSDVKFNQDFWTVAHMGRRFVPPGARRVGTTLAEGGNNLLIGAFQDTAANAITLMVVNRNHGSSTDLEITHGGRVLKYSVPAWGTAVFKWSASSG